MIALAAREIRWQARLLVRNPLAGLLVVALPVVLLPLVHALNPRVMVPLPGSAGDNLLRRSIGAETGWFEYGYQAFGGGPLAPYDQYLVPALVAFGVAAGCFANLAIGLTFAREDGTLKRLRGTPLPPWVHLAGRIASSVVLSLVIAAVTVAAGVAFYGVEIPVRLLPAAVAITGLGAAVFCALGVAVTRLLPNGEAAPAAVFAVLLPMGFLSNSFFPPQLAPQWMQTVAERLPLEPFTTSLATAFNPAVDAPGFTGGKLATLAAWGVFGALAAVFGFRWVPRTEAAKPWSPAVTRAAVGVAVVAVVGAASISWVHRDSPGSAHSVDIGSVEDFPIGTSVTRAVRLAGVRDLPDGLPQSYVNGQREDMQVVVHRTNSGIHALVGSDCVVTDPGGVDGDWLAALGIDPATVRAFVDLCAGSAYDPVGNCLGGTCQPVTRIPADVRSGRVVLRLDEAVRDLLMSSDRPPMPGSGAVTYRTDGSDATIPPTMIAIFDDEAFRLLGPPVEGTDPFQLTIETVGPLGATIRSAFLSGIPFPLGFLASRYPRWLSLPVGQSDENTQAESTTKIARPGPTTWELTFAARGTTLVIDFTTDRHLPPWDSIAVDVHGTDVHGQAVESHLRLHR